MTTKILLIEDDKDTSALFERALKRAGYDVDTADTAASLRSKFLHKGYTAPRLVLLDLQLPDAHGLELIKPILMAWWGVRVIVLSGHVTTARTCRAKDEGAFFVSEKPVDSQELLDLVTESLEGQEALNEASIPAKGPLLVSERMRQVRSVVEKVAPTNVSVLVTGESGTGKEVVAHLIHDLSKRATGPFVPVNCGALPKELIESELFGSVKGAYTGSSGDKKGLFRQAEGGTLFLDEIGEMPFEVQSKLLRVLQESEVRPVGGSICYDVNCRIIAATNREPAASIQNKCLREDLYYRIAGIELQLPPLRERQDDIVPLAHMFLAKFCKAEALPISELSGAAAEALKKHSWPGNVRELQNIVQRAALLCGRSFILPEDLKLTPRANPEKTGVDLQREALINAMAESRNNKSAAARKLGITRNTLMAWIKKMELGPMFEKI